MRRPLARSLVTNAGRWALNPLWRTARAVPSLDLRFAETKSLADAVSGRSLVTFTRASSATVIGSTGVLETVSTDQPRFTHDPITGESLGLLVEEQRTNSIRNNTMQGAVAGTPGTAPTNWTLLGSTSGLAQQIVGTGTENGIDYIEIRFSGTTTGAISSGTIARYETTTQIAASSGQVWTASEYIKLTAGSLSNISFLGIGVIERSAAGGFLDSTTAGITPTAAALISQRRSVTRTLNNASTAFITSQLLISAASGVAIDFTLRIGLPQLEQGAFATSVIPTTTAAATRSADVVSITGTNFSSWYRQDQGTVFAEATNRETYPGINVFPYLAQVDDGTNNNRVSLDFSVLAAGYRYNLAVVSGGSTQFETGPFGITQSSARWAAGVRSSDFASAVSVSPGTLFTSTSGTLPGVMTQLRIGAGFGKAFSGTIRRLTYWPARLPNGTLQALTR